MYLYKKTDKFLQDRFGNRDGRYVYVKELEKTFAECGEYADGYIRAVFDHTLLRDASPWTAQDEDKALAYLDVNPMLSMIGTHLNLYGKLFDDWKHCTCGYAAGDYLGHKNSMSAYWCQYIPLNLLRDWWLAMDKRRTHATWTKLRLKWGSGGNDAYGDIARQFARILNDFTCHQITTFLHNPFRFKHALEGYKTHGRSYWGGYYAGVPGHLQDIAKEVAA